MLILIFGFKKRIYLITQGHMMRIKVKKKEMMMIPRLQLPVWKQCQF